MGQKVNPHGLRVGVIQDWDSRWFANKAKLSATLLLRTTTFSNLHQEEACKDAGVPKVEIEHDMPIR